LQQQAWLMFATVRREERTTRQQAYELYEQADEDIGAISRIGSKLIEVTEKVDCQEFRHKL
jgi:hypothetical protein